MRAIITSVLGVLGLVLSGAALADWHTVTVRNVLLVVDNGNALPGVPSNSVLVWGTFTPALPCQNQAFIFFPSDPLYKETYSMLVAAQMSGTPIRYLNIYCHAGGVSRGNQYQFGS